MNIGKMLKDIREFFWPLLEPLGEVKIKQITIDDCKFSDDELEMELKYLEDNRNSEDNRRKEVESKATIFIGTFAVATTVLINLAKEFIFNSNLGMEALTYAVVFLVSLTIIYLCRAIHFAIKTLKRRSYSTLGFPNFMLTDAVDKKRQIFVEQYNATKKNQKEINIKVDYMTMAQEYFQRAVVTVSLLTVVFLGAFVLQNKSMIGDILDVVQKVTINHTAMVLVVSMAIVLLIVIIILFVKIHSLEKRINEKSS